MAENLQEMLLVCISRAHGLYRVEDDEGGTLLANFASITEPYLLAERIAQAQRQPSERRVSRPVATSQRAEFVAF
jgi:hypothetical protein